MSDIEQWLGPIREFTGAISVGAEWYGKGRRIVVTVLEVWSFQVVIATEQIGGSIEDDMKAGHPMPWSLSDDAGTAYQLAGMSGGGSDRGVRYVVTFTPQPSREATRLHLTHAAFPDDVLTLKLADLQPGRLTGR